MKAMAENSSCVNVVLLHVSVGGSAVIFKVLIVHYGSVAFSTVPLALDEWMWCLFFGIGALLWRALINPIPQRMLPNALLWIRGRMEGDHQVPPCASEAILPRSRVLWLRGISRIRTQIRVVNAFRDATRRRLSLQDPAVVEALQKHPSISRQLPSRVAVKRQEERAAQ